MTHFSDFCTCTDRKCPHHPSNHQQGCTPCIAKNLRLGEIPECFFQKIEGNDQRKGCTMQDFAELVLSEKKNP